MIFTKALFSWRKNLFGTVCLSCSVCLFSPVIVHVLFFHKLTNSKDQKVLHQLNFDDDQALTVKVVNIGGASASGGRMDDEVCLLCRDRRYA